MSSQHTSKHEESRDGKGICPVDLGGKRHTRKDVDTAGQYSEYSEYSEGSILCHQAEI